MPKRRYYRPRKQKGGILKSILKFIGFTTLFFLLIFAGFFVYFAKDLPDPDKIEERLIFQSTKIYDRSGETILYDIHGEEKRTVVAFSEIPQSVKDATIAIEDQNFYSHPGIDIRAIAQALITKLKGGRLRGASTITQQFIKNSILSSERTLTRKIKEAILALELERRYTKDEILEFYLNQIPYGSNAYGIEAAAQTFFSKHARDLTTAEAALLAALPRAPTYYSPYGSHREELLVRKNIVLEVMRKLNFINREQEEEFRKEELDFSETRTTINSPHFVFYVREFLEDKYGQDYLTRAGLRVITTIDWELQQLAEEAVRLGAERNEDLGAFNASLVAIDPKTGQILSMVGSRDYFKDPVPEGCTPGLNCKFEPHVNIVLRSRQPGSAFKPFVYATAMKKGYTDNTIIFDIPTEFNTYCSPTSVPQAPEIECYSPRNFDGRFRGPVTIRTALANSINVPSVKVLYLAGVDDSINTAQDMGITTLKDRSRFGLSLVLGGGEVKLLDITSAFGVFAAEGVRRPPTPILRIEDDKGNILEEFKDEPSQVLDIEIARIISDILSDNNARTLIFGPSSPLAFFDRQVAAKTGTTNEFRDGWTVGYTPSLVVGVWAGNNDNTPMNDQPGLVVASPIWRDFMDSAFEKLDLGPESFVPPEPREGNKLVLNGQYIVGGEIHNILYYLKKDDPLGPPPISRDPQFENWEAAVRRWFGGTPVKSTINIIITNPSAGETVSRTGFTVVASVDSREAVSRMEFFFGDTPIGTITGSGPFFRLPYNLPLDVAEGEHTIKVRAYISGTNFSEKSIKVIVES